MHWEARVKATAYTNGANRLRVRASRENLADLALEIFEIRTEQRLAGIENNRPTSGKFVQMKAHRLAYPPLHAIPDDRFASRPRDREADAGTELVRRQTERREKRA